MNMIKESFKQSKQCSINPVTCHHDPDERAAEAEDEVRSMGVSSGMN